MSLIPEESEGLLGQSPTIVELAHVYKSYQKGQWALSDVSFSLSRGEFVYVTGASGAGKTTLLKLLFCAEKATRGQVAVIGLNLSRLREKDLHILRRNVGVVFQDFKLLARATVFENVAYPLEVVGASRYEMRERVWEVLRWVGLANRAKAYPLFLSGGEQQRAALARALVRQPPLLLADEPTGNIDPRRTKDVMGLLEAANMGGATVIVATHDKGLIQAFSRRVLALDEGKLVYDGPPDDEFVLS